MRKKTFTEEQVAVALREAESGTPVTEVCRRMGVSEQSFYRWKRKYTGMGVTELRRLKQLEEENRKLKKIEAWRIDYNEHRPHSALGNETPHEYAARRKFSRTVKEGVY